MSRASPSEAQRQTNERPIRAAQYVRMSTEHQQYSTENQADVIREWAKAHGVELVRTFSDAGKSGLSIEGRDALKELIGVVERGEADFELILVYDVSRWGRFQDADESAYYEYVCKKAGLRVHYCAEQFLNDGSPVSTIVKGVKRAMAGEYSRELSAKVFKGQCKLVELGFRQGGPAGYGLRRLLIDSTGRPKAKLKPKEHKSLVTDRVVLVPGPPEERAVVREIYRLFVEERLGETAIAAELERAGIPGEEGCPWTPGRVRQVLTNEKYIGNNVFNRRSCKLKKKRVDNPEQMWVRRVGAFEPVVERAQFEAARELILERHQRLTDEEMLKRLEATAQRQGRLTAPLIDGMEDMPSSEAYRRRFGSIGQAYRLIAYRPSRDISYAQVNRRLRALQASLSRDVVTSLEARGGQVTWDAQTGLLTVNGMLTVAIVVAACRRRRGMRARWVVRLDASPTADFTLAVRMDVPNEQPKDYFLFPALDVRGRKLRLEEDNGLFLDGYRSESLDHLVGVYLSGVAETVRASGALPTPAP